MLFGLFPDVDTNSKAQDIFFGLYSLWMFIVTTGNIQAATYLGLIAMLPIVGHHRGWTHKIMGHVCCAAAHFISAVFVQPKCFAYCSTVLRRSSSGLL